ncbi:hypothetical protein L9F63_010815, partial [Diploptera punctata]
NADLKSGSQIWIMRKRDAQRLEAAQIKFLRHIMGVTYMDRIRNETLRQKFNAINIVQEIKEYEQY